MQPPMTLLIQSDKGRDALLSRAGSLPEGECLVKVVDVVGVQRSVRTTPSDPRATLVATEVPAVLRGGLTRLVSYYRAPLDGLAAREAHYVGTGESHAYEVLLSVAKLGREQARAPVVA